MNRTKPAEASAKATSADQSLEQRLPIEIGLIVAGPFTLTERRLLQAVEIRFRSALSSRLPQFEWRITVSRRRDIGKRGQEESTQLLRKATEERDLYHWDFAIVLIDLELLAHFRSFALAVLSRPLDAAIVSTARLIPDPEGPGANHDLPDDAVIIDRITTLLLRAVVHLGGLPASRDPQSLLYRPTSPDQLTVMTRLSADEYDELVENLIDVADLRLEESSQEKPSAVRFLLRAAYINREQILETIVAARPWQFPRRLSRLTTAAVSTVAILLLAAESWDLALAQSWASLASISLIILVSTTVFISLKQDLLLSRSGHHREQIAVTRVCAIDIVMCGLALTWILMLVLALLAVNLLFSHELVSEWTSLASSTGNAGTATLFLKMATFCASVGLLIGALGASFEEQNHFQHVIFVDEEL